MWTRRQLLASLGSLTVPLLAGCSSSSDDSDDSSDDDGAESGDGNSDDPGADPGESGSRSRGDLRAELTPADGTAEQFGEDVALSGDGSTAVVGASSADTDSGENSGAAYVFSRNGESWDQTAELVPSGAEEADFFGSVVTVSEDGSVVIVGNASEDGPNGSNEGAAYVFTQTAEQWTQEARLTAGDGEQRNFFGKSVALTGDGTVAAIGVPRDDPAESAEFAGTVHIFSRTGGDWIRETKVRPTDRDGQDFFGDSVAVSDDASTVIVGSPSDDTSNMERAGSAYAFARSAGGWTQQEKLLPDDANGNDRFGQRVAVSGDGSTALIGAPYDEDPNGEFAGSAYVFSSANGSWQQETKIAADDGQPNDVFGSGVALTPGGERAVVGVAREEGNSTYPVAYVFARESDQWTEAVRFTPEGSSEEATRVAPVAISADGSTGLVSGFFDQDATGSVFVFSTGDA